MVDWKKLFTTDKEYKDISLKHILITSVIITVFINIILFYYAMISQETRNNIIANGQMTALRSKNQLNAYLATSIDAIKLTAYTMEKMQTEGRPRDEMLENLVLQSNAVQRAVIENTTGIYAYIDGEYLDSTYWMPEADFVPTQRPWYQAAIAKGGEVAIVDPYIDAYSGAVMTTISKGFADRKSVIAMDISMERIQQIAENAVMWGDSDAEIIMDSRNMVIAHSDPKEIGKHYSEDENTLWARLAKQIRKQEDNYFETEHDGIKYIVYAARLDNGWLCLSVKNATEVFKPLQRTLIYTLAVLVIVVLILSYIMLKSHQRYETADKLNRQLSSISNIYVSMYDIDIGSNRFIEIKSANQHISHIVKAIDNAQEMVNSLGRDVVDADYLSDAIRFTNLGTLDERLRNEETIAMEFLSTDGKWIRLRFIVSARDKDGTPYRVLLLGEDIDNEKKERDALVDMSERAIAASEAKSSFLSNMSHEIRTPINAVLGMNEMILRECSDDNIIAYAESIKIAGGTLLGLINDILDFSKIEAGKLEILPIEYDLSSVLNDLVNMVQTRADDKGLILSLNFDKETPKRLYGDEVRIKQVVTNILTNAVKYTEKGTITFSVSFEREADDNDSVNLLFEVKDTGIGIKAEDMKKLFTEFERIEETRNRNVEGTGLGMSITKKLLHMMGTSLQVESEYGHGSQFYFKLKQTVVKWEQLGDYAASYHALLKERKAYREKFIAPEANVLVVDDNPMNLMVFKSLLKQTRVKVDTANDGEEGLLLTQDKKYDLIFLDHMMPGKDGIETLRELRTYKNNPNAETPAVCLTANAVSGAREQYMIAGFDDYLTKPIDSVKLEDMMLLYLPKEKIRSGNEEKVSEEKETNTPDIPEILAPLRDEDWLDISEGIKFSQELETYLPLLKVFYESIQKNAKEIDGYYKTEDWKDYTIKVHALKSSARLIGATKFGEEAQSLENAGKCEDIDYIREHHEEFIAKYISFAAPLAKVFAVTETEEEKPEANENMIEGFLEGIEFAVGDEDGELLADIFTEMDEYSIPKEQSVLFEKIRSAAEKSDFEAIRQLLAAR